MEGTVPLRSGPECRGIMKHVKELRCEADLHVDFFNSAW
jgi:hypothetical protein